VPVAGGPVVGQNPAPFTGAAPFGPPNFLPVSGATVGVAQPIIINFPGRVADSAVAESAVHISSFPPVSGKFYWLTPTQLRWRPFNFWPANTAVTIDKIAVGGWVAIGLTGYSYAYVQLSNASSNHAAAGAAPFGLEVYGYGTYTSYWYPGGLNLKS
jgi:lipoprotein-anchoring transpeptidase ErfK/SrfK